MSYFEECLTLGQWLSQEQRRALYKYLLLKKDAEYSLAAYKLLKDESLTRSIALGEIKFTVIGRIASYQTKSKSQLNFTETIRHMRLSRFGLLNIHRLKRLIAQSEVDALSNYPIPGINPQESRSFTIDHFPYYSLRNYAEGRGILYGVINKARKSESEVLEKLLTS